MTWNATALFLALAATAPAEETQPHTGASSPSAWSYVLPPPGDPFDHAPFRAWCSPAKGPTSWSRKQRIEATHLAAATRIRFGSPSSIRVTIVLDETPDSAVDLYVDADRNLRIEDHDRLSDTPADASSRGARIWRLPLNVALDRERDRRAPIPRVVVFRLGASGQTLGYATAGYIEGTVALGDGATPGHRRPPP